MKKPQSRTSCTEASLLSFLFSLAPICSMLLLLLHLSTISSEMAPVISPLPLVQQLIIHPTSHIVSEDQVGFISLSQALARSTLASPQKHVINCRSCFSLSDHRSSSTSNRNHHLLCLSVMTNLHPQVQDQEMPSASLPVYSVSTTSSVDTVTKSPKRVEKANRG